MDTYNSGTSSTEISYVQEKKEKWGKFVGIASGLLLVFGVVLTGRDISDLVEEFNFWVLQDLVWSLAYVSLGGFGLYTGIKQEPKLCRAYLLTLFSFASFYLVLSLIALIYINSKLSSASYRRAHKIHDGDETMFLVGSVIVFILLFSICGFCLFLAVMLKRSTDHYISITIDAGPSHGTNDSYSPPKQTG
jgi:hypothetical protein